MNYLDELGKRKRKKEEEMRRGKEKGKGFVIKLLYLYN